MSAEPQWETVERCAALGDGGLCIGEAGAAVLEGPKVKGSVWVAAAAVAGVPTSAVLEEGAS
ncbi:hypothetical protein GCM10009827_110840 [Dactylosporangium maewongense]|uniref:Uncharacterized protein n=1 Tax=Dactylosporangium maewongense TaxID=634393 RepID=A0ABN2D845_9ACTN